MKTKVEVAVVEAPDAETVVVVPKVTIGEVARNLILKAELSNTEILAEIMARFPEAKTTMACIAWYKSDMRKNGTIAKPVRKAKIVKAFTREELTKMLEALV